MRFPVAVVFILLAQLPLRQIYAQDPDFSHFYANSLQLNPALAGLDGHPRVYIGYRNQWPSAGSAFITYQSSYDQYIEKLHGGVGVKLLNDQQGDGVLSSINLDVMYSYHFRATRKWFFTGALQAGVGQRSFNANKLEFGDMYDPVSMDIKYSSSEDIQGYFEVYPDFAAGFSAYSGNFYGGAAVMHLLSPVVTDEDDPEGKISRRYMLHAGFMIPIIDNSNSRKILDLSPNVVYRQQNNVQQINYGLDAIIRDVLVGVWTRHDFKFNYGNLIFTAGYGTRNFRFRYTYDIKLKSPTISLPNMAAHEISLLITFENSRINQLSSAIKYPKF